MYDLAILGGELYHEGSLKHWNLYLKGETIAALTPEIYPARKEVRAEGLQVFPGIIDPHVHFHLQAGRWTSADDFISGSEAALFGGVCCCIDFLDPVRRGDQVAAALEKRKELARECRVDYSFHVCAANPVGQCREISEQAVELHLPSIKLFTAYSESGRRTYDRELAEFLSLSEELGTCVLVHAEDEDFLLKDEAARPQDLPRLRPPQSEWSMVRKLGQHLRRQGGTLYMVHCSSGESLEILQRDFSDLLNRRFFVESCPQYFYLNQERFMDEEGWRYVLAPPLRSLEEQEKLRKGLPVIYSIGTDHCPFSEEEKHQEYLKDIPFGIGGIEYSFPLLYSLFGLPVVDKMTRNPASIFKLPKKGRLDTGYDGDFFLFDPIKSAPIRENHSRAFSVYREFPVKGEILSTYIRGQAAMERGKLQSHTGRFIERDPGGPL